MIRRKEYYKNMFEEPDLGRFWGTCVKAEDVKDFSKGLWNKSIYYYLGYRSRPSSNILQKL